MEKMRLILAATVFAGLGAKLIDLPFNPSANTLMAADLQPVTLRFQGNVGDQVFQCGESYPLGQPATPVTPTDFRFYVSDVALIDAGGRTVPVTLEQDGKWQYQSVALLDFEDKSAACANGTEDTRDRIVGTVPPGTYQAVQFTLGVPFDLNHGDATLAPSPLNLTALWWNWRGGYKFLRIDLASAATPHGGSHHPSTRQLIGHTPAHPDLGHSPNSDPHHAQGFAIHLGSTACQANTTSQAPTDCAHPNRSEVTLNGFDPEQQLIVADLAALVASTNVSINQPDTPAGCMASPDDEDCRGIMHNAGLPFGEQPSTGQQFFRVEPF